MKKKGEENMKERISKQCMCECKGVMECEGDGEGSLKRERDKKT